MKKHANSIMQCLTALLLSFLFIPGASATVKNSSTVELMGRKFSLYKVDKKESLYAVSRRYGLEYDQLSHWNQGIEGDVPKGYLLYMPEGEPCDSMPATKTITLVKYKVKPGDTLYSLAKKYNSTVKDIISCSNNELRSSVLSADAHIVIPQNSAFKSFNAVQEERTGIVGFLYYKVKKDESAEGIASSHGISRQLLAEANPGTVIKNNSVLSIPILGKVSYTTYKPSEDKREYTSSGQQEIFDSLSNIFKENKAINVVVLLNNPSSNKDVDFSRGILTAARDFGKGHRKTNIEFVNGANASQQILEQPALISADIIFTTYDAEVPEFLASFADNTGKTLVNAFSVKDSLYLTHPSVINLLSSPSSFNAQTAQYIIENFKDSYIVFIGDPFKVDDKIATMVMNGLDPESFDVVKELTDVVPHPSRGMTFYSMANGKQDIKKSIEEISKWIAAHPGVEVNSIGRPSWIVYVDNYAEELKNIHANVPTRFHFQEKAPEAQQFLKKYYDFFKANPVRSYPAYSVMGYDAAWFFLRPGSEHTNLQMPFRLTRVSGGGEYNSSAIMLRYLPDMPVNEFDIVPYLYSSTENE